jgi:hypothetical protein
VGVAPPVVVVPGGREGCADAAGVEPPPAALAAGAADSALDGALEGAALAPDGATLAPAALVAVAAGALVAVAAAPQAARKPAIAEAEQPRATARRMKSRRPIRPSVNCRSRSRGVALVMAPVSFRSNPIPIPWYSSRQGHNCSS